MNSVRLLLRSLIARYHAADDDDNEHGHPTALFESPSSAPPPLQTVLSTDDELELAKRARSPTPTDLHALMADEDARRARLFQREGRGAKAARRGSRSPPGAHVGFQLAQRHTQRVVCCAACGARRGRRALRRPPPPPRRRARASTASRPSAPPRALPHRVPRPAHRRLALPAARGAARGGAGGRLLARRQRVHALRAAGRRRRARRALPHKGGDVHVRAARFGAQFAIRRAILRRAILGRAIRRRFLSGAPTPPLRYALANVRCRRCDVFVGVKVTSLEVHAQTEAAQRHHAQVRTMP